MAGFGTLFTLAVVAALWVQDLSYGAALQAQAPLSICSCQEVEGVNEYGQLIAPPGCTFESEYGKVCYVNIEQIYYNAPQGQSIEGTTSFPADPIEGSDYLITS